MKPLRVIDPAKLTILEILHMEAAGFDMTEAWRLSALAINRIVREMKAA